MENEKKITIVSTVNGPVGVTLPDLRFKREWPKKGAKVLVEESLLEDMMFDNGVQYMFETGILYIEDMEVKKKIGLEPDTAVEPERIIVLSDEQIKRQLTLVPVFEFKKTIQSLSKEQRQNLVAYAIDNDILPMDRIDIIKEFAGVDLLQSISLKRASKEG